MEFKEFYDKALDLFIDSNNYQIYNKIVEIRPEMIPNDDWYLEEHTDEVIDFIEEFMMNEFLDFILNSSQKDFE